MSSFVPAAANAPFCCMLQPSACMISESRFYVGESPFLRLKLRRSVNPRGRGVHDSGAGRLSGSRLTRLCRAQLGGRSDDLQLGSKRSNYVDVGEGQADHDAAAAPPADDQLHLERRSLLAASVAGVSTLLSYPAMAVPVTPPDLAKCQPATVVLAGKPTLNVKCCLPESAAPPKPFKPSPGSVLKVRRRANTLDAAYKEKYNQAYEKMRALPDTDPRSFKQQADVHCAFCNGAYPLPQSSNASDDLQIHFSYIFFPWHRYYLYFHEKILGSLIDDPSFTLPFWNWDDQKFGGNIMPEIFLQPQTYPALYDEKRNQNHIPPAINTLSLSDASNSSLTDSQIINENLSVMYQSTVKPTTATGFMGAAPLFGDFNDETSGGTLELGPHTAIHVWSGDPRQTYGENMGNLYSAGRDPIFYAHHANVDRTWAVWDTLKGRRRDLYTDQDFLNSSFVFYNENSELVQVFSKDCLDSKNQLGIIYEEAPGDKFWINYQPQPLSKVKGVVPKGKATLPEIGSAGKDKKPQKFTTTLSSVVARPTDKLADYAKSKGLSESEVEEVLVLQDVQVPKLSATHLAVFINLPDADTKTSLDCAEYVGSYANAPHIGMKMSDSRRNNVKFSINDNIKRLGIEDQDKITVTVVAKVLAADAAPVTIAGFKIIYF